MNKNNTPEKPADLKKAVRNLSRSESLSAQQLATLMKMQQTLSQAGKNDTINNRRLWNSKTLRFGMVAVLPLIFVALLLWQLAHFSQADYPQEIALEVVGNHLRLKPLDVNTDSLIGIQDYFSMLDFSPINPAILDSQFSVSEENLLGGRYCSIKGVTAAQLRYQASPKTVNTLYEVPYDPDTFGPIPDIDQNQAPLSLMVKGLRVSLWVEKGLLIALVDAG